MSKTLEQISPDVAEDLELLFKSMEMEIIRAIGDFERLTKTVISTDISIAREKDLSITCLNYGLTRRQIGQMIFDNRFEELKK